MVPMQTRLLSQRKASGEEQIACEKRCGGRSEACLIQRGGVVELTRLTLTGHEDALTHHRWHCDSSHRHHCPDRSQEIGSSARRQQRKPIRAWVR